MDSSALLDLLGNENRRRILRLLARRPWYVTEMSETLGVSPKALIDHLRKLEDAGIVRSYTENGRRKYFQIDRNLRLEVHVSPYDFGTKSAYPASRNLDLSSCRHLSVNLTQERPRDQRALVNELAHYLELENELSLAQRWVQGRLTEVFEELTEAVDEIPDERLMIGVLRSIARGSHQTHDIAREVDAPPPVVDRVLGLLAEEGLVTEQDDRWELNA